MHMCMCICIYAHRIAHTQNISMCLLRDAYVCRHTCQYACIYGTICIHMCIHAFLYAYIYMQLYMHIFFIYPEIYLHTKHMIISPRMQTDMPICKHTCTDTRIYTCMHYIIHVCDYICIFAIYIYIYIYLQKSLHVQMYNLMCMCSFIYAQMAQDTPQSVKVQLVTHQQTVAAHV